MQGALFPADAEINMFVARLGKFRDSLTRPEQRLLDAMYLAALGSDGRSPDIEPYWALATSIVNPPKSGMTLATTLSSTPWHAAFRSYS